MWDKERDSERVDNGAEKHNKPQHKGCSLLSGTKWLVSLLIVLVITACVIIGALVYMRPYFHGLYISTNQTEAGGNEIMIIWGK